MKLLAQKGPKHPIDIAVLKYGQTRPGEFIPIADYYHHLRDMGFPIGNDLPDDNYHNIYVYNLLRDNAQYDQVDSTHARTLARFNNNNPTSKEHIFRLRSSAFFLILEHEELEHAREASLSASRQALAAIVLSLCAMLSSIVFSYYSIANPQHVIIIGDTRKTPELVTITSDSKQEPLHVIISGDARKEPEQVIISGDTRKEPQRVFVINMDKKAPEIELKK